MFFVPVAILVIEDEDDRTFMENLYSSYHRLMYHTIHLITEDPWITEDILQSTTEKLIQNLDTIKHLSLSLFVSTSIWSSVNSPSLSCILSWVAKYSASSLGLISSQPITVSTW